MQVQKGLSSRALQWKAVRIISWLLAKKNTQAQSAKVDKELHIYIIEANRESNIMHSSQKKSEKIKMQKKYIEHKEERIWFVQ